MLYRAICIFAVTGFFAGCAESDVPSAEATLAVFNVAGAPTVEFSVPDMMCPDSCAVATREILAAQAGAKEVRVDFEQKTATVAIDASTFQADDALAALADRGFVHSTLKSETVVAGPAEL